MISPLAGGLRRWRCTALPGACAVLLGGALLYPCAAEVRGGSRGTGVVSTRSAERGEGREDGLPDIAALMHDAEVHQRANEAASQQYIYRCVETAAEGDGKGGVKKDTVRVFDVFWSHGVPVRRMVSKDGRALSAEELRKEDERIEKEVAKARERREANEAKGKETGPRGDAVVTVSRILELGVFSNERAQLLNGRPAIVVDYAGDPKAKTRDRMEEVLRDLVGTVWVDERDREIVKLEGHFVHDFKIGGGLVVNVHKETSFAMEQRKVNSEVWLPLWMEGHGAFRAMLLFSFNGSVHLQNSDFRKFQGTVTMLPGVVVVDKQPESANPQNQ